MSDTITFSLPDVPEDVTSMSDGDLYTAHDQFGQARELVRVAQLPVLREVQRREALVAQTVAAEPHEGGVVGHVPTTQEA